MEKNKVINLSQITTLEEVDLVVENWERRSSKLFGIILSDDSTPLSTVERASDLDVVLRKRIRKLHRIFNDLRFIENYRPEQNPREVSVGVGLINTIFGKR